MVPELPQWSILSPALQDCVRTGILSKGHFVQDFEQAVARYIGVPHVVAVSSCSVGLLLVLRTVARGTEVIIPSFTFCATANAIEMAGFRPVCVDVDSKTFLIDSTAVRDAINPHTAAIVAVDIFGSIAHSRELDAIASMHGIPLIYDSAHSFGSRKDGRIAGQFGVASVFSTSPTKVLTTCEGGLVATADEKLANEIRGIRDYGIRAGSDCLRPGINARMHEFDAVLGLKGVPLVDAIIEKKILYASRYIDRLSAISGIGFQMMPLGVRSNYKDFAILIDEAGFGRSRDALARLLKAEGIDTRAYFSPSVHQLSFYRQRYGELSLPWSEAISSSVLLLPIHTSLSESDIDAVCDLIRSSAR
jgi:dTDP-4-amino-4,6-dideoxygalactose transaminase